MGLAYHVSGKPSLPCIWMLYRELTKPWIQWTPIALENWQNLGFNEMLCGVYALPNNLAWLGIPQDCPELSDGGEGFIFTTKILMTLRPYRFALPSQWSDNLIPKVQLRIASIFSSSFDQAKWGRWSFYRSKMDHLSQNAAFFLDDFASHKMGEVEIA